MPGLWVLGDFITEAHAEELWDFLYASPWRSDVCHPKRTQHYGPAFSFLSSEPDVSKSATVPEVLQRLVRKLHGFLSRDHYEIMVIEYLTGQGITPHIDSPVFGDTVASLSLGREMTMRFQHTAPPHEIVDVAMPHRSLLVMSGYPRHRWFHEIPEESNDGRGGPRVSLTIRDQVAGHI